MSSYRIPVSFITQTVLIAAFVLVPAVGVLAQAPEAPVPQQRLITAFGEADVRVPPDLAEVRLGVETEAPTVTQAREENAARAAQVVAAIRALNIPEADIQTSVFQVQPIRRWDEQPPGRGEPPIVGYRVVNVISVRTAQFDLVPRIIDQSIAAGANRVESVNFILRDDRDAAQRALRQAVANARQNAQSIAAELNIQLGPLHSVQQGGVAVAPPPVFLRAAAVAEAFQTPIFPGEVTVNASATLAYYIQQ